MLLDGFGVFLINGDLINKLFFNLFNLGDIFLFFAVFKNWSSGQDGFPRRTKGKNKGMSTVEIANFLTEIGFDNVTAKKVEKAAPLKDPITLSSSDLTETDLYQATKILELLGSTPLKTCVHNFDERLFSTN